MGTPRRLLLASRPVLLLAPLLLPAFVPLSRLTPGLAFALTSGRWLILLGAIASIVLLARDPRHPERSEGSGHSPIPPPRLFLLTWVLGFALFLALVPAHR